MRTWWTAIALAACSLLAACAGAPPARDLTLVLIRTGPQSETLPAEERQQLFAGHFSNMQRLAEERQLLLAGPFGPVRHDQALRGLFVLDTDDPARAREWAGTDPTAQAGVFVLEYHELSTDAPLRALLEHELGLEAEAHAKGIVRPPGEGGRSYVLLTAEDGERARRALQPLRQSGLVLLLGRLDRTRAFAVLDAADPDSARTALGAAAAELGPFVLDGWYATGELARIGSLSD
jgi:uncharacterized protein YciI